MEYRNLHSLMPAKESHQEPYITEQEYLEGEKHATERHEYVNGRVYAMAGASKRHNRIARNFINRMEAAANKAGCEVFFSDIKVRTERHKTYYYPDVVVACDQNEDDEYYLQNPCLIIEVTSATTLRKDYLEKALSYQSIPSLRAYLIVAQDKTQIDMLLRHEDSWELQQFDQIHDTIDLPCIDMRLSLNDIYAGIDTNSD